MKFECAKHPGTPAVGMCIKCERTFCERDIEKIGRGYLCYECLKDVARDTKVKGIALPLTLKLIIAGGAFLSLGVVALLERGSFISQFFNAMLASKTQAYVSANTSELINTALKLGAAAVSFIEGYGLLMNQSFSYYLGIILTAGMFVLAVNYYASQNLSLVFSSTGSGAWFFVQLVGPIVLLALILIDKSELLGSG